MSPGETAPVTVLAELPAFGVQVASTLNQIGLYYTTAVMILAVGLVVRTVSRYEHLDGRLGPAIIFVGVWPWLANLFVPQMGVTQMGGEISFSENEPRGSVVSVTLPLADENRSAERHPAGTTAE